MTDQSPYYLDGITSAPKIVSLSVTDQSLIISMGTQTLAVWPFARLHVKEDWIKGAGVILGFKGNPDASLTIYNLKDFQSIKNKLSRKHRASSIIPSQYHHLLVLTAIAVAAVIVIFPLLTQLANMVTYLVPQYVEEKLGNYVITEMADEFTPCDDKVALSHLQVISHRLLAATDQKNMTVDIHFFKSSTPNAFSLPGQKIAVLSGFLHDAQSENEIAAVMAHEMGHIIKRDALEAFVESQGIGAIITLIGSSNSYGELTKFASLMQSMNYSRQKEFNADEYGAKLLIKAGYSPKGLSAFLLRMDKEHPLLGGRAAEYEEYLEFLSTHPDTKERVRRLNNFKGKDAYTPSLKKDEFLRLKNACS